MREFAAHTPVRDFVSLRDALDKLFEDSFIKPLVPSGGASFELPLSVDPIKIEATFKNGVRAASRQRPGRRRSRPGRPFTCARPSESLTFTADASRKMRLGNPTLPDDVSIIVLELGL